MTPQQSGGVVLGANTMIPTRLCYVFLLLFPVLNVSASEVAIADKLVQFRNDAQIAFSKACDKNGNVLDADAYSTYKTILVSNYLPAAEEYVKALGQSVVLNQDEKQTKSQQILADLERLKNPSRLCVQPPLQQSEVNSEGAIPATPVPQSATTDRGSQHLATSKAASRDVSTGQNQFGHFGTGCSHTPRWNENDCQESPSIIGGVEQSGLSSLNNSTGAFVSFFIRAPNASLLKAWTRIRLLDAPQGSNDNVINTFLDPTGTIQKVDFSKVGQAIDFFLGGDYQIPKLTTETGQYSISLIAGYGATTPLSSEDVVLRYQVPAPGTVECSTLIDKFSSKNGYNPSLAPDATGKNCLSGGYQFFGLSNQDRTNFLSKYGAGVRAVSRYCSDPAADGTCPKGAYERGIFDFAFGQDSSVTGGVLRHFVFKVDGTYPLPFGSSKYVYLFGSASLRTTRNRNSDPLILNTADSTQAPIPSANVIVLPLKQSDRDFYRIGVGLNISAIISTLGQKKQTPSSQGQ